MQCVICGYEMRNDTVVMWKRLANVFELQKKENKNVQEKI